MHCSLWNVIHDVQFQCAKTQPLLAHHWRVHQSLLTSRFIAPLIPWGVSAPGGKMRKQLLKNHNFLNNSPIFIIERSTFNIFVFVSKKHCMQYISIWKLFWIWWKVLDTIILWQDVGPCCEQTQTAFEMGLSLDQGLGVYSGRSDVDDSSQVRICHTCIIDVMCSPMPQVNGGLAKPPLTLGIGDQLQCKHLKLLLWCNYFSVP